MRPGIVSKTQDGKIQCTPIRSRIVSLFAEHNELQYAVPGGLIGEGACTCVCVCGGGGGGGQLRMCVCVCVSTMNYSTPSRRTHRLGYVYYM